MEEIYLLNLFQLALSFRSASKMTINQTQQKPAKQRSAKLLMFDLTLEGANLWFDVFNVVLLVGAFAVAVGTWGAIKTASIKEKFADERISANEAETARAVADSDAAREGTARANQRIEELRAASLALEAQIAPRRLAKQEMAALTAALRASRTLGWPCPHTNQTPTELS